VTGSGVFRGSVYLGDGADRFDDTHGRLAGLHHQQSIVYGQGGDDTLVLGGKQGAWAFGDDATTSAGAGDDRIVGSNGQDHLYGGGGDDTIIGRGGVDVLSGGDGADHFVFNRLSDIGSSQADTISDMDASDTIDLHSIDANAGRAGNQHFHMVDQFNGHAGEALLLHSGADPGIFMLELDVNGDAQPDAILTLDGDVMGHLVL
jgi:Ca2+-binding RTX toxin-like protein